MKSRKHLQRVAELPCSVCCTHPVQVHHIIGRDLRIDSKGSDYLTIPLCPTCHQNLHDGGWRSWEQGAGSQVKHLAKTLAMLFGDT